MPDCYHVVSSTPEGTLDDLSSCVNEHKGNGHAEAIRVDDEGKLYSLIHYEDEAEAREALERISNCLREKNHEVTEQILWHLPERGLRAPDYPDGGDGSESTAA